MSETKTPVVTGTLLNRVLVIENPVSGFVGKVPSAHIDYIRGALELNKLLAISPEDNERSWDLLGDFCSEVGGLQTFSCCCECPKHSSCGTYTLLDDLVSVLNGDRDICLTCGNTYAQGTLHTCRPSRQKGPDATVQIDQNPGN